VLVNDEQDRSVPDLQRAGGGERQIPSSGPLLRRLLPAPL
jgi:hypothetical protein